MTHNVRQFRVCLGVLLTIGGVGCGGDASSPSPTDSAPQAVPKHAISPPPPSSSEQRAAEVLGELSRNQLVGQRILYSFEGTELPRVVAERLRAGRAAGVVLFERNYSSDAQFRALTRKIRRLSLVPSDHPPALVMVDQEGGHIRRLPTAPQRSASRMGAELSNAQIESEGAATGHGLRRLGVNVDLAPVVDIGRPRGALRRERRTFSDSPDRVSSAARSFGVGLRSTGVAATAKHFPGFGSARVNTDYGPSVVERSRQEAREDLDPFRAQVADEVELVMLSTAIYPALSDRPAALTESIAVDLLRHRLGFTGVTITDALDTPAVAAFADRSSVAVTALGVPVDLLLYAHSTHASVDAEAAAIEALQNGDLSPKEMRASAERILRLRFFLPSR